MVFVGRVDNQVKILGYRVELGEVEAKLREAGRTDFAIAVPWPVAAGAGASGLVACLAGSPVPDEAVLEACRTTLPAYMVPHWILRLDRMPLNSNGKIDRNALKSLVEEQSGRR
jgi:acyl-coenzyme A synthetase/AMP-(fatty) acid ligase